jgi:hypothetical protein
MDSAIGLSTMITLDAEDFRALFDGIHMKKLKIVKPKSNTW